MTHRVCACGRGCSMEGKRGGAKWASRACAVRWSRENPGRPLSDAYNPHRTRTRRRARPSGWQMSFWKAQGKLEEHFISRGEPFPYRLSVNILADALSDRQRAQLRKCIPAVKLAPTLTIAEQRRLYEREAA
jgi:hypothetical protein